MIKSFIVGIALALTAGAPVYAADAGPSAPAAPKVATVVACEAYVYKGTQTNLCGGYPTAKDLDCKLLAKPVQVVVKGVDPWKLDADGDGIGCDLPAGGTSSSASASASASTSSSASPTSSSSATSGPAAGTSPTSGSSGTSATGPQLPLTGPSVWVIAGVGLALTVVGLAAMAARRRRTRFEA